MKRRLALLSAFIGLLPIQAGAQTIPAGYPAEYSDLISNAKSEGSVLIYSSTESSSVLGLIERFKEIYPGIAVDFLDLNSNEVYTRLTSEMAAGVRSADLIWAGSDSVSQLADAGMAMVYKTPELPHLIDGVVWNDMAFGVTIEPVVVVYNPRLLQDDLVPGTHGELLDLLTGKASDLRGMVGTLDPRRSAAGLAYSMADSDEDPEGTRKLIQAFGAAGAMLYSSTSSMVEKVVSGEHAVAYNVAGSTASKIAASSKGNLATAKLCDYTLHLMRTMMIPSKAEHSNAAKLFLDFTYSKEGQDILAKTPFGTVREDVENDPALAMPAECPEARRLFSPGPDRLRTFNEDARTSYLAAWQKAFAGQ